MIYKVYFASVGIPATGLTPTWDNLKKVSDGSDYAPQPLISEIGGGWYQTENITFTEDVTGVIDGGSSLGDTDRYVPFDGSPGDSGGVDGVIVVNPGSAPSQTTLNVLWRGKNGMADVQAMIRRVDDGLYWNRTLVAWGAVGDAIYLTEISPGFYGGTANFYPGPGTTYEIEVRNGATTPIIKSYYTYPGEKKAALEHVNDVQSALRMPASADFTAPHAKLVLSQINKAITLMIEAAVWPEMKVQGSFWTVAGIDLYTIRPANTQGVERFDRLQIGTSLPISVVPDTEFRSYKARQTSQNQPVYARYYGRMGDAILLELSPVPNAAYEVSFDGVLRVPRLVLPTDTPVLDDDMVALGGIAFSKQEQGEAFQEDMAMFTAKVEGQRNHDTEMNWGDAEPV